MVVVIFRSRLREGVDTEYGKLAKQMEELSSKAAGFVSSKDFSNPDGERVSVIEFDSPENLEAWYRHPEHIVVQKRGRDEFYESFQVQVCSPIRQYSFDR